MVIGTIGHRDQAAAEWIAPHLPKVIADKIPGCAALLAELQPDTAAMRKITAAVLAGDHTVIRNLLIVRFGASVAADMIQPLVILASATIMGAMLTGATLDPRKAMATDLAAYGLAGVKAGEFILLALQNAIVTSARRAYQIYSAPTQVADPVIAPPTTSLKRAVEEYMEFQEEVRKMPRETQISAPVELRRAALRVKIRTEFEAEHNRNTALTRGLATMRAAHQQDQETDKIFHDALRPELGRDPAVQRAVNQFQRLLQRGRAARGIGAEARPSPADPMVAVSEGLVTLQALNQETDRIASILADAYRAVPIFGLSEDEIEGYEASLRTAEQEAQDKAKAAKRRAAGYAIAQTAACAAAYVATRHFTVSSQA
jgi:hypothetical protein